MKTLAVSVFCAAFLTYVYAGVAVQSGIDPVHMDKSVRLQDDLYLAVNGTWLKKTEIPADKSNYGAFTALDDLSRERVRSLIEAAAAKGQAPGSDAQKVGDLYRSFMDEKTIEEHGLTPLQGELDAIRKLSTRADVASHFGRFVQVGLACPFSFYVEQDQKDSTQYIAALSQAGTGLPDRDYYLKDDPKFKEARTAYVAYIAKLLTLAGQEPAQAEAAAQAILSFETSLAKVQSTNVELRDPEKNYNKMPVAKLAELAPDFDWGKYFDGMGAGAVKELDVGQPSFVKGANDVFKAASVDLLKNYLVFHLLDAHAIALPAVFQAAHFELHGKVLAGIPEDEPRWKKAVGLISGKGAFDFGVLGDALGKLYVEKYFPTESKARIDALVQNLLKAFDEGINNLAWMTPETKSQAHAKLAKYTFKVGYPTRWRDYSALQIKSDDLLGNLLTSERLEFRRNFEKLGKPIDRQEWQMTPQTVNAYYSPSGNEIVFPAAILQPPYFHAEADDAVNYGGIGAVIGHETSHGFDDQGAQYDGDGNLRNWWSEKDKKAFTALTQRLVAQYAAYEPLPGKHVNGELTLGENIADLSGLAVAHRAYQISLGGKPAVVIDGLSGDQRFYMGWAQVWKRKYRDAELVKRLLTDPHSPSHFRGIGPVMNSTPFYQAFEVKPSDKMYKPESERIVIW